MASLLAALGLLVNALVWGVSWWPFRQLEALGVHPLWATAMIYLLAAVVLLIVRPGTWRAFAKFPALWVLLVAAGLTNVSFNWAVTVGDVVRVVLLFYLMPAWVVLLAWPILGERPTAGSLARLGLALAGVVIVLKTDNSPWPWPNALPDYLALMAGFCFALTNVMLRKLGSAPAAAGMLAMFAGGTLMAGLAALWGLYSGIVPALPVVSITSITWPLWVGGLSLMFLVANFGLQYGAARLSANTGALIMLSEVVFASGSAVLLGAGTVTPQTLLGGTLIVMASLLSVWAHGRPTAPAA
ncbi:MAG: EamA family transporter [Burkholderiales bacterium PBB3]|nr:MAG: EamA family transporter [Burkholderiales bacterium PBB3]